jgi:hypothetical protein
VYTGIGTGATSAISQGHKKVIAREKLFALHDVVV